MDLEAGSYFVAFYKNKYVALQNSYTLTSISKLKLASGETKLCVDESFTPKPEEWVEIAKVLESLNFDTLVIVKWSECIEVIFDYFESIICLCDIQYVEDSYPKVKSLTLAGSWGDCYVQRVFPNLEYLSCTYHPNVVEFGKLITLAIRSGGGSWGEISGADLLMLSQTLKHLIMFGMKVLNLPTLTNCTLETLVMVNLFQITDKDTEAEAYVDFLKSVAAQVSNTNIQRHSNLTTISDEPIKTSRSGKSCLIRKLFPAYKYNEKRETSLETLSK